MILSACGVWGRTKKENRLTRGLFTESGFYVVENRFSCSRHAATPLGDAGYRAIQFADET